MVKIIELTRFGENEEYLDITFKNDFDEEIRVGIDYKRDVIRLTCDDSNIVDIKEVLALVEALVKIKKRLRK